ncbi:LexA family transcriptional regulator [Soonwooa sp.]|uniref:XRE family transcriptional regulator n=1 Tax=Soonwooa sp. TaxID=1938592 RepID=UPI0028A6DFC5|nr:LexA family transcriptional regulator [Soonwooa sp.]
MSILSENIRFLRVRQKYSQQKLADSLFITRVRYAKYEDGTSEPPIELLLRISKYFQISIDLLVSVDIRKYPLEKMLNLPDNRILIPIAVDVAGNNQIEIIPQKASMGYLNGYSDPEYIEGLQTISLPFLRNGKYRAFPASGDSMPPYKDGTYIVGKYVENLSDLKIDKTYVFITTNDGILYKRFQFNEANFICVKSDNNFYEPLQIPLTDVREIWEFACSISTQEFDADEFSGQNVKDLFLELKQDIKDMKTKLPSGKTAK